MGRGAVRGAATRTYMLMHSRDPNEAEAARVQTEARARAPGVGLVEEVAVLVVQRPAIVGVSAKKDLAPLVVLVAAVEHGAAVRV